MFATLVFGLTVGMIGVHVGEWVLLGKMMGAPTLSGQGTRGESGKGSGLSRVMGMMNFLRLEALYYVVLLVFWWLDREAVPAWAVLGLGAAHIAGWAALERKGAPKLESAGEPSGRLRKVLAGIAGFDAVEVVILGYLAWRLWPR